MKQHDVKQDEAFVKELDTMEEVQAALKAKGVEVSVEELLKMAQPQTEGELDEDALEDVAGGAFSKNHILNLLECKNFPTKVTDTLNQMLLRMG